MSTITINTSSLKACAFAMSKEKCRYYLNGVYFDDGILVATDGHKLAAIKPATWESEKGESFILPSDTVAKIIAVKPHSKKMPPLLVTFDTETKIARVHHTDKEGNEMPLAAFPYKPIDGTFPSWRRVIPSSENFQRGEEKESNLNAAGFNSEYLGMFKAFGKSVKMFLNLSPAEPCIFRARNDEFEALGLLMPMRVDEFSDVVPSWVKEKPPVSE